MIRCNQGGQTMKKSVVTVIMTVRKVGKPEDYFHLPLVRDGKAIGVVIGAVEQEDTYKLEAKLWTNTDLEIVDNAPSAIVFGGK